MGKSFLGSPLCLSADFPAPPKEKERLITGLQSYDDDDDNKNPNQQVSCHRGATSCPFWVT